MLFFKVNINRNNKDWLGKLVVVKLLYLRYLIFNIFIKIGPNSRLPVLNYIFKKRLSGIDDHGFCKMGPKTKSNSCHYSIRSRANVNEFGVV